MPVPTHCQRLYKNPHQDLTHYRQYVKRRRHELITHSRIYSSSTHLRHNKNQLTNTKISLLAQATEFLNHKSKHRTTNHHTNLPHSEYSVPPLRTALVCERGDLRCARARKLPSVTHTHHKRTEQCKSEWGSGRRFKCSSIYWEECRCWFHVIWVEIILWSYR